MLAIVFGVKKLYKLIYQLKNILFVIDTFSNVEI